MAITVPLTVPDAQRQAYQDALNLITKGTGRLLLFACDQKIEHLHKDFYGQGLPAEISTPEHVFKIASSAPIGAFATHLGMVARHGAAYKNIPYIIKVNGKSDLVPTAQAEPLSAQLLSISDVVDFKKRSGLTIPGVGMTIYLGSEHEHLMLQQASRLVLEAHAQGLIVILWVYPRGKAVADEKTLEIIAGAAGVAHSLGADFVKINVPTASDAYTRAQALAVSVAAAGNTGVICSGGSMRQEQDFLTDLYHALHTGGITGAAVGRNIFQKPYAQAVAFTQAIAGMIYEDKDIDQALKMLI